ncbi:MAG: hypothetical protein WBA89_22430 [Microcoleus sp.]|uniref:hypothetical protein n=1 Tax=Microcoleus sp. TaxID=44472 RepID=UPI003C7289D8
MWANVRRLRAVKVDRQLDISSDSFCLTGEFRSPNQSDVQKNLSQGGESRITHPTADRIASFPKAFG